MVGVVGSREGDVEASSPWRRPGFRWFAAGQFVSLLGSALAPVALAFAVLDASGHSSDLSWVLVARTVPMLVFLLLGGAAADRFSRSQVLVLSNAAAGVTQAVVATLLITDRYNLAAVMVLEALNGTFAAFTTPALRAVVPELVDRSALQPANSILATGRNATRVLGPGAAGVAISTVGGGWAIAIDAASYLIAAGCMIPLRLPARGSEQPSTLLADLREGWTEFRSLKWVVTLVLAYAVTNFLLSGIWLVLGPTIALASIGATAWGIALSARALGLLMAGAAMYRVKVRYLLRLGQLGAVLPAVPFVVLGLGLPAGWLIASAFVAGVGAAVEALSWETSMQEHVRPAVLSRVSSYDNLGSFITVPLGALAVIPIAAAVDADRVAVVGGVLYALITLATLASRSVRDLEHRW